MKFNVSQWIASVRRSPRVRYGLFVLVGAGWGAVVLGVPRLISIAEPLATNRPELTLGASISDTASAINMSGSRPFADGIDSVIVPDWVRLSGSSSGVPRRPYVPLGEDPRRGSSTAGRHSSEHTVVSAVDLDLVRPLLAQRVAAGRLMFQDIGLGTGNVTAGSWSIPGQCNTTLRLVDPGTGVGEELGRMGDWIFTIAVPMTACSAATHFAAPRKVPSAREREDFALAVQTSSIVRELGAPIFRAADLRDLATATVAGVPMAWGVFRSIVVTTQIYPPPPLPQLAFVARREAGGRWTILWAKYADSAAETVGLAGVYDYDRDGGPDAFFGVRDERGGSRLLHVTALAEGQWGLRQVIGIGS